MNEERDEWLKELKLPDGASFLEYDKFPIFELRLDKDKKLNGDFYLYLEKDDGTYYGIIKVDGNKNVKEVYRDATDEEIIKYNVDPECKLNGSIFVSENAEHKVTHIYYYITNEELLRKDVNSGHIIQYDFYCGRDIKSQTSDKNILELVDKFDAKYIITFHELNSNNIDSYCIGVVGYSIHLIVSVSDKYNFFRNNILNLKNISF